MFRLRNIDTSLTNRFVNLILCGSHILGYCSVIHMEQHQYSMWIMQGTLAKRHLLAHRVSV